MKKYTFIEATPLLSFLEENKSKIVGHILKHLFANFWPDKGRYSMSDEPFIIELDDCFILIQYLIPSDITFYVGSEDEIRQIDNDILRIKEYVNDYYGEEFGSGEKKEDIEDNVIRDITVERFSHAFEYNIRGDMRPEGGDYFSTIRLHLESGKTLCFVGDDAIVDGYIRYWCE